MGFAVHDRAPERFAGGAPGRATFSGMRYGFRVAPRLDAHLIQKSFESGFADVVDEAGNKALDQHQSLAR